MFSRTPSCNVVAGHGCFELTFKLKEIVSMHYNFKIDLLRDQKSFLWVFWYFYASETQSMCYIFLRKW